MTSALPSKIQSTVNSLLTTPGSSALDLRQSVEAYAASLGGATRPEQKLPQELEPYIRKVTLHAYKVTDKDVQELITAGYSEDEIFELTVSAGVGAGLARLERGLHALKGLS